MLWRKGSAVHQTLAGGNPGEDSVLALVYGPIVFQREAPTKNTPRAGGEVMIGRQGYQLA